MEKLKAQKTENKEVITRRHFLEGLFATATAGALTAVFDEKSREETFANEKSDVSFWMSRVFENHKDTVVETFLLNLGEEFFVFCESKIELSKKLGVRFGNATMEDENINKINGDHTGTIVIAPFLEELVFRKIVSEFVTKLLGDGLFMGVGAISSFLFALGHNLDVKENTETGEAKMVYSKDFFHITAFFGGLYLWYLMRKRGFSDAFLSHAQHNIFCVVYENLKDAFPGKDSTI